MDKKSVGELVKNIGLGIFIVGLYELSKNNFKKSFIGIILGIVIMIIGIITKNKGEK